jgi:1-acyl-sn-glycerol-3-phosphate acyltransferase
MLRFLPAPLRGVLLLSWITLHTLAHCLLLFGVALLKLAIASQGWRRGCDRVLNSLASSWIGCNNAGIALVNAVRWKVTGLENLSCRGWYLVMANHQSWVDILVLQRIFHRRIPFLKFFLKNELIWVPVLGLAWWALDFPFMRRYSREEIEKHPHLKGRDLETTRRACEKFKRLPIAVMNFVEGTRFTARKHAHQRSPFVHLLRPRAGGLAFVLAAMGDKLERILDVTIAYPGAQRRLWDFLCGRIREVRVRVVARAIDPVWLGDYEQDSEFRERFQKHLNALWSEKDRTIDALLEQEPSPPLAAALLKGPGASAAAWCSTPLAPQPADSPSAPPPRP